MNNELLVLSIRSASVVCEVSEDEFYQNTNIYIDGRNILSDLKNVDSFLKQSCKFTIAGDPVGEAKKKVGGIDYQQVSQLRVIFSKLKGLLLRRKEFVDSGRRYTEVKDICACVTAWPNKPNTYILLLNQLLEQGMISQASANLKASLDAEEWVSRSFAIS